MGLMNRMRDKTHIILIVLVLAFLGTIIFQWGMDYLGSKGQQFLEFGSVNGDEINQNEFEKQVQAYAQQQKDQTGEDPDDATMQMIRQQVWENLVQTALVHQEAKRLGVKVTDQEVIDFVFQYPEQVIGQSAQQFRDSATGIFDVEKFRSALVNPENKQKVAEIENSVRERLLTLKVTSLVSASIIIPESDVRQKFKDDNIFASFDYIFLDLGQVPDGQVQVTDDDLKNYYEKN